MNSNFLVRADSLVACSQFFGVGVGEGWGVGRAGVGEVRLARGRRGEGQGFEGVELRLGLVRMIWRSLGFSLYSNTRFGSEV